MPFASAGIEVQPATGPLNEARKFARTRSNCSPTLNGLQLPIAVLNGPGAVLSIPSGKDGRCRKPIARSLNANAPLNCKPSLAARSTYAPKPAARSAVAAFALEKKAAVRAF